MREEFVSDLKEGMVTGKSVFTTDGLLIVPEGVSLTAPIIRHLDALNVFSIIIMEASDMKQEVEQESVISEELVAFQDSYVKAKDKLNDTFEKVMNLKADKKDIINLITESWSVCKKANNSYDTINMLYSMHSYSDSTYMHSMNVGIIASLIGRWLGWSEADQKRLHTCGLFHDIGKLKIPKSILDKPGKLTDEEYATMKTHTILGYNLLRDMGLESCVVNSALMHHERCDGTGYPMGATRDKIDKYSKVVAIADVYEAMTANRVYRSAMCPFDVIARIEEEGFMHFETEYLLVFLQNIVDTYLNSKVTLSNGEKAEIVLINRQQGSRPLVLTTSGRAIDLTKDKSITITEVDSM